MAEKSDRIVKISFLDYDRLGNPLRRKVSAVKGKFPVTTNSGKARQYLSALAFIELIIKRDPVIYLNDDRCRLKVCQGDSAEMRVDMLCVIEAHDKAFRYSFPKW